MEAPAVLVSQRTGWNTIYEFEKLSLLPSQQDVPLYNVVPQLNSPDKNWAVIHPLDNFVRWTHKTILFYNFQGNKSA